MRAGNLDRTIAVDAYSSGAPDVYGNSTDGWTAIMPQLRAQLVTMSTEEYLRAYGEGADTTLVFRTRFIEGITTKHRVRYDGREFDINEVKEIGRRRGLELRCNEVRT